jgi:CheY-like chemotaxis protein
MPKTLLLADDSVVIQKLVGLSFANEDVELVTTDNGDDAIVKAREINPDVVLADVVMPGKSGYEVCEAIKKDPALANTPVLLLTGTFEAFDEDRASQCGSDGHITKPFEAQALVDRVTALLDAPPPPVAAVTAPTVDEGFDFLQDEAPQQNETQGDLEPPMAQTLETSPTAPVAPPGDQSNDFGGLTGSPASNGDPLDAFASSEPMDLPGTAGGDAPDLDMTMVASPAVPGTDGARPPTPSGEVASPAADAAGQTTPFELPVSAEPGWSADGTPPPAPDDALDSLLEAAPMTSVAAAAAPTIPDSIPEPMSFNAPIPDEVGADLTPSLHADPSLTTVIMSDGQSSADGVTVGMGNETPVASPMPFEEPSPFAASPQSGDSDPLLADDLFDTDAAFSTPAADAVYEFGDDDPRAADVVGRDAQDYDISLSQPVDPPAIDRAQQDDVTAEATWPSDSPTAAANAGEPARELSNALQPTSEPGSNMSPNIGADMTEVVMASSPASRPEPRPKPMPAEPIPSAAAAEPSGAGPDISPVMRDRIHETLERVAWEAFSDLSETIVKEALQRIETIAWEVIPQMAETLIKEEIRRMKGDDE